MLNALFLAAGLALAPSPQIDSSLQAESADAAAHAGIILVRGGPDRRGPFADLKDKRGQAADQQKDARQESAK